MIKLRNSVKLLQRCPTGLFAATTQPKHCRASLQLEKDWEDRRGGSLGAVQPWASPEPFGIAAGRAIEPFQDKTVFSG